MSITTVTKHYRDELIAAVNELQRLEADYFELGTQIAKQKKKVAALHELADLDDEGLAPIGLVEGITDACRTVFRAADKPLAAFQVKTRVESLGLPPQQNLMASIHTVIRRLVAANEIEEVPPRSGTYKLKLVIPALPSFLRNAHAVQKMIGADSKPNSAYESGMRGNEKPKLDDFKPTYNPPDPLNKRGKK